MEIFSESVLGRGDGRNIMEGEWWRRRSEAWEGLVRIVMVTVATKLRRPGRLNN